MLLERCMAGQNINITPTDNECLRQVYDNNIYLCRHPACEGRMDLQGFYSIAQREAHEARHSRPFVCSDPSCEQSWGKVGFSTKAGLNKHVRNFHRQYGDAGDEGSVKLESLKDILLNERKLDESIDERLERGVAQSGLDSSPSQRRTRPRKAGKEEKGKATDKEL